MSMCVLVRLILVYYSLTLIFETYQNKLAVINQNFNMDSVKEPSYIPEHNDSAILNTRHNLMKHCLTHTCKM